MSGSAKTKTTLIPAYQHRPQDEYWYVRVHYGCPVAPGDRVRDAHTRLTGSVEREQPRYPAQVMVRFGPSSLRAVHPRDLEYGVE